jgi:hypothetical protein
MGTKKIETATQAQTKTQIHRFTRSGLSESSTVRFKSRAMASKTQTSNEIV